METDAGVAVRAAEPATTGVGSLSSGGAHPTCGGSAVPSWPSPWRMRLLRPPPGPTARCRRKQERRRIPQHTRRCRMSRTPDLLWRELHWQRPLGLDGPLIAIRACAADAASPTIVLEARATAGRVRSLLGATR